jgi:amino acid transporter
MVKYYKWFSNAITLVLIIIMVVLSVGLLMHSPPANFRSYDCSMAEFHPDYPVKVKQACREQFKQQMEKSQ